MAEAPVDDFGRYLEVLVGSWEALAVPQPEAVVVRDPRFVTCRSPFPVLNNAVILDATAVPDIKLAYAGADGYAVWSCPADDALSAALESAGFRRDVTTRPMLCRPAELPPGPVGPGPGVLRDVDPARVAGLTGVHPDLFRGVPGLTAYVTDDDQSGLVVIAVGRDVNISAVTTHPSARRRGLAAAVTRAVLADARDRGYLTASLQATPEAEQLYARVGFRPVGRWQEWVPAD